MGNKPKQIEIEELREAGEDGGDLMGYFCRGHIERHLFADAANEFSGAQSSWDIRHVDPKKCRHVWWRLVQMSGEPKGTMEFQASTPGRGASAYTVCNCLDDNQIRQTRQLIKEYDKGKCSGISEGIRWALEFLEFRDRGLHDAMLQAFRERRPEIEKVATP